MKNSFFFSSLCIGFLISTTINAAPSTDSGELERGHYLIKISGCNDCHTPGYRQSSGKIPEPIG